MMASGRGRKEGRRTKKSINDAKRVMTNEEADDGKGDGAAHESNGEEDISRDTRARREVTRKGRRVEGRRTKISMSIIEHEEVEGSLGSPATEAKGS